MTQLSVMSEDDSDDSDEMDDFNDDIDKVVEVFVGQDNDDDAPSDVEQDDDESNESTTDSVQDLLLYVQSLGAITGRGEFASKDQHRSAKDVIEQLVAQAPAVTNESQLQGRWELVYCSTQLFRSSPFFMAGRAVCQDGDQADQYNWFCDMHRKALAISTIKSVRQVIGNGRLTSEFEVSAGAIPFLNDLTPFSYSGGLPLTIEGAIVSTADIVDTTITGSSAAWELFMDTVEIKGSNLPILRQLLDSDKVQLDSRSLSQRLEQLNADYQPPRPIFRNVFVNDKFRVSQDQDNHYFVYVKTSTDTAPTEYNNVDADLGILGLLEGFNDAVTKFYL